MLKIAVCDDEKNITDEICFLIDKYKTKISDFPDFEISVFNSGADFLTTEKQFDLVFLDIEIKEMNGIEIAKILNEQNPKIIIIFVSSYTKYVTNTYRVHAFQFLVKPIDERIFCEELTRAMQTYLCNQDDYIIDNKDEIICLKTHDIVYLESNNNRLKICDINGKVFYTYGKISDEELKLKPFHFIRCHHGFLVNLAHIKVVQKNEILVNLKYKGAPYAIPISKRRKKYVEQALKSYIAGVSL